MSTFTPGQADASRGGAIRDGSWTVPSLATAICFLGPLAFSFCNMLGLSGEHVRLRLKPPCAASAVASHNIAVGAVGALSPLTLGAGSVVVAGTTGVLVGKVLAAPLVFDVEPTWVAKALLPHGVIEVPTLLLLSASGFRLFLATIRRSDVGFHRALLVSVLATLASVPLFAVSAAIECRHI